MLSGLSAARLACCLICLLVDLHVAWFGCCMTCLMFGLHAAWLACCLTCLILGLPAALLDQASSIESMKLGLRRFFSLLAITDEGDYTAVGVVCGVYKQGLLQDTVRHPLTDCCPPIVASRLRRLLLAVYCLLHVTYRLMRTAGRQPLASCCFPLPASRLSPLQCRTS